MRVGNRSDWTPRSALKDLGLFVVVVNVLMMLGAIVGVIAFGWVWVAHALFLAATGGTP